MLRRPRDRLDVPAAGMGVRPRERVETSPRLLQGDGRGDGNEGQPGAVGSSDGRG